MQYSDNFIPTNYQTPSFSRKRESILNFKHQSHRFQHMGATLAVKLFQSLIDNSLVNLLNKTARQKY